VHFQQYVRFVNKSLTPLVIVLARTFPPLVLDDAFSVNLLTPFEIDRLKAEMLLADRYDVSATAVRLSGCRRWRTSEKWRSKNRSIPSSSGHGRRAGQ
jgi:hypothetical protein